MKTGLKRIEIQEEVIVEALLDSKAMELVMSSEFVRKQRCYDLRLKYKSKRITLYWVILSDMVHIGGESL